MFVVTMNKKNLHRAVVLAGCVFLTVVAIFAVTGIKKSVSAAASATPSAVYTTQDMVEYLLGYGVEADAGSAEVSKVKIPKKFDSDFQAFHEMLKESGMNLESYRGKEADKWILSAPNKTVKEETAYAVLLVRNQKVIAAYLLFKPSGTVEALSARPTLAKADSAPPADGIPQVGAQGLVSAQAQTEQGIPVQENVDVQPVVPVE